MIEVIFGVVILAWLFFKWWLIPSTYWKERGFPHLEYKFPFGTYKDLVLLRKYLGYTYGKVYKEMGDLEYAGIIVMRTPQLVLKDPEVIKAVMTKDFTHFSNRTSVDNVTAKEPLSFHLFNLGGDKWKALRTKLTPTFTSGKLKLMFPLFESCSKNLEEILDKMIETDPEIEVKDIIGRYTTKIIGTCAYGIDVDSLDNKDSTFVKLTRRIFAKSIPWKRKIIVLLKMVSPVLRRVLRFRISSLEMEKFLTDLVLDTMSYRENNPIKRNDFIDLLMEIKTKQGITIDSIEHGGKVTVDITDVDLVAQVFVFLAAGYETSASVTSYCLHELASNPDIQEKLRKEIQAGLPLTYQSLQEMQYLDMTVNETMRKHPTLPLLTRKCTKDYVMPNGSVLEKDTSVMIPVYALHHDPQHYPEPDKFDPERFTHENKMSRHQYSFLPFGEGPRLCIGMRFGLLQTKMGIATILSKYRVEMTSNTVHPLNFVATPLISSIDHPIKLAFKKLDN